MLAKPAWLGGSRRLPASKSICTSTMAMAGLSTRKTWAPLAWVQCWIGMAASAMELENKQIRPAAQYIRAQAAMFLIANFMAIMAFSGS
ncbi:hypothetical protein LP416_20330 [Polaromonas sp. P2-4]|nr:hypothetical protein LP416_20330 [Polaromonas sp. P2-4]